MHLAGEHSVAFEGLQGLGEHLLADPLDLATQGVEPEVALAEREQGEARPLRGDVFEGRARRAVAREDRA